MLFVWEIDAYVDGPLLQGVSPVHDTSGPLLTLTLFHGGAGALICVHAAKGAC